jgi:two-component sensor histidine kinase
MNRIAWVFGLGFALAGMTTSSQKSFSADSLHRTIQNSKNTDARFDRALQAAEIAYEIDKEYVAEFTTIAKEAALQLNDSTRWAEAMKLEAAADRWMGNYVKSIASFKVCHDYFTRHNDTTKRIFAADHLGSMHMFMGYNTDAQRYLTEVYELEKHRNQPSGMADALNGLAIFYNNLNQNDKAEERYKEALTLYEQTDDTLGRANVHANLGLLYVDLKRLDEAEYHLKQQGHLDSLLDSKWGLGFHFDFMGHLERERGNLEKAYKYHLTALNLRETLESHYNISESRTNLTSVLYELGNYQESIEQASLILENRERHQSLNHQLTAFDYLARSHEQLGNFKDALGYYRNYMAINDSISNKDIMEIIAEKDAKFEVAEERNRNALLNAENEASTAIIGQKSRTIFYGSLGLCIALVLSSILTVLVFKYNKRKKELGVALGDKEILLREIHHRVKNNLQIVSSLLSLQGRSIENTEIQQAINDGQSRVRSMALIHQNLYQRDNLTGVSMSDYLSNLCEELFTTYTIDKDRIQLQLNIQPIELDVDTLVPLGLIINELISNTLKHAFPNEQKGIVSIAFSEEQDQYNLTVRDNGVGFIADNVRQNAFGNKLIQSLSRQLHAKMEQDSNPKDGTTTRLHVPKRSKAA